MSDIAIEFDNVVAGYGDFMILNNLSLKAKRGKITLLLGPNGAGKSTVLKTLFGMLKVRSGRVRLDGEDITGASAKDLLVKHGVAFVPQGRNLFGQLSVWENLELGGITLGMKTTHERIPEVLERFPRVKERLNSAASMLSGGEQKQLEVGRALLLRPNSGGFDYVSTYGAGSATVRVTNGVTSITPTSGPAAQLGPLQLELLGALDDQVFGASLTSGGVLGNQLWSAEIAPPLSASTNPAGFQTADVAVVPMTIGGAEILPICAHPPAVAPENHPHVFHPDSTGAVVDTGATFTWMRTMVLSIRYSDQTLATFLALSPQDANGAKRVVADVTFADGEEALCSGSDVTQFSDQAAVGHESSGATPETGQSHPTRARKFPHPAK